MKPPLPLMALLVTLCACTTPDAPPVPAADMRAASQAEIGCMKHFAASLDDGKSDAATIGLAVAHACEQETRAAAAVVARGQNGRVQAMTEANLLSDAPKTATEAVLLQRRPQKPQ